MLEHPNVVGLEFFLVVQYPICQTMNWLQIIKSKVQKLRQIPPLQARPEAEMPSRVFPSVSPKQKNLWCLIGYRKANQILLSTMTTFQLTTSKAAGALRVLPRIYWGRPQVRSKMFAQPKNGKKNFIFIVLCKLKLKKKVRLTTLKAAGALRVLPCIYCYSLFWNKNFRKGNVAI